MADAGSRSRSSRGASVSPAPGGAGSVLPSGTVTFLFTDVEGSTRLWERFPEAMGPALTRHDRILRDAVAAHGGQVVKSTGDGIHAVFTTTRAALESALAAQHALAAEDWGPVGELRARMGLHTGDTELREGDYYGPATNRAARVTAAAHGGQVVVSHATEEIVRDWLPEGVDLLDLGEHRLPDIARAERIFQAAAPGLRREFPPLRTLEAMPGNLPRQLTSFVGRAADRAALAEALARVRLLTVTGVAGVGKSRLALRVAVDVQGRFPDGTWLCDMASLEDGEEVLRTLATTLSITPRAGAPLERTLVDALRSKELLLLLDNCEQVLDPVARLAELVLGECPHVRIVATSREALAVPGEQVWPLAALPTPPAVADPGVIAVNDAVLLFSDRARAVHPSFALDATNTRAVAEICRRLDGIPLAIELAAARVAIMAPAEIAARLDQRFQFLTGGRRTAAERHQTLRGAIEWSYEMLDPVERTVYERLGVFPASFDVDAASSIVAGEGVESWDVLEGVAGLLGKSMLTADESTGATRYQMLETLRAYARERLEAGGDAARWLRHHAGFYARFADEAGVGLLGPDEGAWRRRVHLEYENWRAAIVRCVRRGTDDDVRLALGIVGALGLEALRDRSLRIGRWAEELVDRLDPAPPDVRAAVLAAAAFGAQGRGDWATMHERALAATSQGAEPGRFGADLASLSLATSLGALGRVDEALDVVRAATGEGAVRRTTTVVSFLHGLAATFLTLAADLVAARTEADRALAAARESGSISARASALFVLADALGPDEPDAAHAALDESIELAREGASRETFGYALAHRAALRARTGDLEGATADLAEAVERSAADGDQPMLLTALESAVVVLGARGDDERAAVLAGTLQAEGRELEAGMAAQLGVGDAIRGVQARLGEAAYADALARGAALASDDLVVRVRRWFGTALEEMDAA